jgi:hypothetical protein
MDSMKKKISERNENPFPEDATATRIFFNC